MRLYQHRFQFTPMRWLVQRTPLGETAVGIMPQGGFFGTIIYRERVLIKILATFMFVFIIINNELFAQGCSQCRMVPQSNLDAGGSIATNLNPAILYLMVIPYVIILFIFRKQLASLFGKIRGRKA